MTGLYLSLPDSYSVTLNYGDHKLAVIVVASSLTEAISRAADHFKINMSNIVSATPLSKVLV